MPKEQQYTPHPLYKVVAILGLVLAALLGWETAQNISPGLILFFCISLGIAIWSLLAVFSRVELTPAGVCQATLLHGRQCVEFRQLVSVSEEGRVNQVIAVLYHPQLDNGLLDLDQVHTLHLPAVNGQTDLLAHLQARTPV